MKKPLLNELTLREKIGQTALGLPQNIGFKDLKKYPYGSLWAHGGIAMKNINMNEAYSKTAITPTEWADNIKTMNEQLKVPILPANDFTSRASFKDYGMVHDAVAVGATDSEELAYEGGAIRARIIKNFGSRWMWVQEVDLPNRNMSVMHGRLFSDNPEKVVKMNIASMRGAQENGVAATAKHFPGSDGIEYRDPHCSDNMMILPVEEWKMKQGKVFQEMIDAGVYTVMVGHAAFPFYDNTQKNGRYVPSTLSKKVITDLLKGEMGFKGVVITDSIGMRSAMTYCDDDLSKLYIEAINAGNDVILSVRDCYFDIIEDAVLKGIIPESRIDEACQRVLDLKEKLGMFDEDFQEKEGDIEQINLDIKAFNKKVSERALSLVCDKNNILPISADRVKKVSIIYSGHDKEGADRAFDHLEYMKSAFEQRGATVNIYRRLSENDQIKEIAENSDLIVYVGFLMRYAPQGFSGFYDEEKDTFAHALRYGAEKSVAVGLGTPFMYYDFYYCFPTFINAYNDMKETQEAFVSALYGEIGFEGVEPFELVPPEVKHYLKMLDE